MPSKIIGLVVACVLALLGGASLTMPAVAVPRASTTAAELAAKAKAAKLKAATLKVAKAEAAATARAQAAAAAKAKARAAAKKRAAAAALAKKVAQAGPRAAAAARAARAARARATAATQKATSARVAATAAAKAAAAARARASAVAKTTATATVKKKTASAAKAAAKAAVKAAAKARNAATAAAKARAHAVAAEAAAAEAKLNYVALAQPRAALAAKAAAKARARAAVAARARTRAQAAATAAAQAAAAAQAKAVAVAKSAARPKAKKAAATAAQAAAKASAKAALRARASAAAHTKALALVRSTAATAAATKAAAGPNPLWAPRDSLVFNNPRGSKAQQLAIITQINQAIDATPAGGQIRMAMYLFDIGSVAQKLIAASKRGVSVQILIDDGESNKHIRSVRKAAGTNKKARSYVATCDHSCMSDGASVIHAKFYLFSVAGKARYVSMISSANPYTGNTFNSWNNNHTIVGDKTIYNSLSRYFTDMLADKKNLNYFRVTTSGKYTVYLYPQTVRRPEDIVLLNVLDHTRCTPTARGYGSQGRTLIRLANWGWTGARMDIAKRLWQLHNGGCKVQVMINKGRISRGILKVLLKPSAKYGKMPVYDAWYDPNHNDVAGLYLHHKTLTINGILGGHNVKTTWTGSQNLTLLATVANNDIILRVVDAAVTDAYNTNFAYIRKHYSRRMYTVPAVTGRIKRD